MGESPRQPKHTLLEIACQKEVRHTTPLKIRAVVLVSRIRATQVLACAFAASACIIRRVSEEGELGILVIKESTDAARLKELAAETFGDMVKAVVDIRRHMIALGGELQADEEMALFEHGSQQADLWGINIYPNKQRSEWIEFDSVINIRPRQNNRSRYVEDKATRETITRIVDSLIL